MKAPATEPTNTLLRTPLYAVHRGLGAKLVEFAGWKMPVQYHGVIQEHLAVRDHAGLFDVSHMGEIEIKGPDALALCQKLTANDVSRMKVSDAQYNLLLYDSGGIVDDLMVYRLAENQFLLCVNAANTAKDVNWILDHSEGNVEIRDVSNSYVLLALQGPVAHEILQRVTAVPLDELKAFHYTYGDLAAVRCLVSRTGYTGEDGFELYCEPNGGEDLWNLLMEAGKEFGLKPVGLGARDTLRLERALPLYGHELDEQTTPLEARLEWVVKFSKGEFLGREPLLQQKKNGVKRKLVGLEMIGSGIPRSRYSIFKNGLPLGSVTSGTMSPSLRKPIAMGYVSSEEAAVDNLLEIDVRGRRVEAKVVALPFYRRGHKP